MIPPHPRSTLTDPLVPHTPLLRSHLQSCGVHGAPTRTRDHLGLTGLAKLVVASRPRPATGQGEPVQRREASASIHAAIALGQVGLGTCHGSSSPMTCKSRHRV